MFKGSMPALITPFTPDGELDLDTLKKFVEWQIDQGSHGLVPCGTTGESPTLSHEEDRAVVREVVRILPAAGAPRDEAHQVRVALLENRQQAGRRRRGGHDGEALGC